MREKSALAASSPVSLANAKNQPPRGNRAIKEKNSTNVSLSILIVLYRKSTCYLRELAVYQVYFAIEIVLSTVPNFLNFLTFHLRLENLHVNRSIDSKVESPINRVNRAKFHRFSQTSLPSSSELVNSLS